MFKSAEQLNGIDQAASKTSIDQQEEDSQTHTNGGITPEGITATPPRNSWQVLDQIRETLAQRKAKI